MTARTLMVQGTGSDVGKSIITAGLCRWFYRRGWKVAPFKAQNMSLNSFVTKEGGEMGRAQVYQAEACGLKPHVSMNPILLKPSADNLSQVVVMGRAVDQRNAQDYFAERPVYWNEVREAFRWLQERHELVILEGAGSPAEINLRHHDFVNMPMAEMADAPVLLVGDIDRGGVFAWLKGTLDLLSTGERDRVRGFIINKFRGDLELLRPGLAMLEEMTGKPVLGVIPFDRDLFADEEDSIHYHSSREQAAFSDASLDVAVVRLPRIANFTDFGALAHDPDISLRYVWNKHQVGQPDLIILPGTKNTIEDLQFLYAQGLDRVLRTCLDRGTVLLGVCGGYQMLGRRVTDPEGVESRIREVEGLGLFELETEMRPTKITCQVRVATKESPVFRGGLPVQAYEIHSGVTRVEGSHHPLFSGEGDPDVLGLCNDSGTVIGTYLHGFLDDDGLRAAFLNHVRRLRSRPEPERDFHYGEFRSRQLDRLGELIGASLDMAAIERLARGE